MAKIVKKEQLQSLSGLLERINYDRERLEVESATFFMDETYLSIRDKHLGLRAKVKVPAKVVNDIVADFKELTCSDIDLAHYYWLWKLAGEFQRDRLLSEVLDVLVFQAVDELTEYPELVAA